MKKIAYLLPPTQRTISRFLNLSDWVKWSTKMLEVYHSLKAHEREVFSFIPANASLIDELSQVTTCISKIEYICKHKGFSKETVCECQKEIEKHQAILNAEVFKVIASDSTLLKGVLGVRVKHRKPILRVMSSSGSYYMDETGEKIPVSTSYAAKVLVATGFFSEEFASEKLLPFVLFLEENPFWKAQITQIHVEKSGDLLLTPLVGNHLIELGSLDNFQKKLRNMKTFYEQILARNNWEKYEKISLKYKNQIVAKKR